MNSEEQFKKEQREMTNARLLEIVGDQISRLAMTGGRGHTMTVPPRVDDTDMILSELLNRFKQMERDRDELREFVAGLADSGFWHPMRLGAKELLNKNT